MTLHDGTATEALAINERVGCRTRMTPMDRLRAMLSASPAFQAWVGATGNVAAAAARVGQFDSDDAVPLPRAILFEGSGTGRHPIAIDTFCQSGAIRMRFEEAVPGDHLDAVLSVVNPQEVLADLQDRTSEVLDDLELLSLQGGYLLITSILPAGQDAHKLEDAEPGVEVAAWVDYDVRYGGG